MGPSFLFVFPPKNSITALNAQSIQLIQVIIYELLRKSEPEEYQNTDENIVQQKPSRRVRVENAHLQQQGRGRGRREAVLWPHQLLQRDPPFTPVYDRFGGKELLKSLQTQPPTPPSMHALSPVYKPGS